MKDESQNTNRSTGRWTDRIVSTENETSEVAGAGVPAADDHLTLRGNIIFDQRNRVLFVSKDLRVDPMLSLDGYQSTLDVLLSKLFVRMPGATETILGDILSKTSSSVAEHDRTMFEDWKPGFYSIGVELSRIPDCGWILGLEIHLGFRADKNGSPDASRDKLTGATNRAAFEECLDFALKALPSSDACLPLFFIDLDRFKAVNDTLGHDTGDRLLRMVCDRLHGALKITDVLGRLGGDEFAVILSENPAREEMDQLGRRLIDLIGRPYLIEGQVVNVGSSIGIAVAPADGATRTEILRSADLALYHSKNAGRGVCHFFDPAMRARAEERRALEFDLRKALVLRQLELHYQPQIDVESRSIIGLEGLLRWRHPKRGLLLPADFLPLAEEIGLLLPIGEWVLNTACKEASTWSNKIAIAVNVSALQFENPAFIASVEMALLRAGLDGSRLEVEVTENILIRSTEIALSKLELLRKMGVHITMDSFGTGLASLSHLVQFPFNKIKIDRTLVSDVPFDSKSRAILRAVSALGQSLGIATLATGVETRDHLSRIQQEGCQAVRGFFYSAAVSPKGLDALMASFEGDNMECRFQEAS